MGRPAVQRRMLPIDEAANYCGLSVNSFRDYVRVNPVKFGRSVRYDIKALDDWLDQFRELPKGEKRGFADAAGENRAD